MIISAIVTVTSLWAVSSEPDRGSAAGLSNGTVKGKKDKLRMTLSPSTVSSSTTDDKPTSAFVEGDIILGGLFPVHEHGSGIEPCGRVQMERGIQRMEAMLYALDDVNTRNSQLLSGIRLGADIRDTCSRDTHALEEALQYVKASMSGIESGEYICNDGSVAQSQSRVRPVAAVIGASLSSVSIQVNIQIHGTD